jgi:sugar phosphate isomerase/epimerase
MKGPAIFLAQFMGDEAPFNNLESICSWAKSLGYIGVQIPSWDSRCIDLQKAAENKIYCDELKGKLADIGIEITELSTHLQGQLVAVHPAYDTMFDNFAPLECRNNPKKRTEWAIQQLHYAAKASQNLGLNAHASFTGAFVWPYVYPWPQRSEGLVVTAFEELGKRWLPILNKFDDCGVDICYEIHPGEDTHDGDSWEMFLDAVKQHPRANILYDPSHFVLQCIDYLAFIDHYHDRIKMFHVKDAEFNPTGKKGVYGGFQSWVNRAGRFRSIGDGQVSFVDVFSKFAQYDYKGWAVLEWECCIKDSAQGALEGAPLISSYMIEKAKRAFDDFAAGDIDISLNKKILGI